MDTSKPMEKVASFFSAHGVLLAFLAGVVWLFYSLTGYLSAFTPVDLFVTYVLAGIAVVTAKNFLQRKQSGAGIGLLQVVHLALAAGILVIISYIYVYYVPSIASEGLYTLGLAKSGIDKSAGFQNVLYGIGVLAAAAMVVDFMAAAVSGKSSKMAVLVLLLLSSSFLFLLLAGVFGEGQRQTFQVKLSQREATEAISTMETYRPPFAAAEKIILDSRKPYMQILTAGDVSAANLRQSVLTAARDAANGCRNLPGTLTSVIDNIAAIPEAERSGGSVTSASGKAGEGPRYRALARMLQAPMSPINGGVRIAMNDLRTLQLPTQADATAADVLNTYRAQCELVRGEIVQRLDLLREAQATPLGATFSEDEENFVKNQQIQPVISKAEAVLKSLKDFPDLNILVTEDVDSEGMASARASLESLSEMIGLVKQAEAEFIAKAERLRRDVDNIDWEAPKETLEEQVREFFAEISVSSTAFKVGKGQEIVNLATVLGNDELQAQLQEMLDGYQPPAIEVPNEASLYDTWFDQGGEGVWQLFVAVIIALTVETLVLWGATLLLTSIGKMFYNEGQKRKGAVEAAPADEKAKSATS